MLHGARSTVELRDKCWDAKRTFAVNAADLMGRAFSRARGIGHTIAEGMLKTGAALHDGIS